MEREGTNSLNLGPGLSPSKPSRVLAEEASEEEPPTDETITDARLLRACGVLMTSCQKGMPFEWLLEELKVVIHSDCHGNHRIIRTIVNLFEHMEYQVRQAAVQALPKVASSPAGDEYCKEVVIAKLGHKENYVRQTAMEALVKVSDRDCKSVIEALRLKMQDKEIAVRKDAARAVGWLLAGDEFNRNSADDVEIERR